MTGETSHLVQEIADALRDEDEIWRPSLLAKWQYPAQLSLSTLFCVPLSTCCHTIDQTIAYRLLSREVMWHKPATWRKLADLPSDFRLIDDAVIHIDIQMGIGYLLLSLFSTMP